MHRDPPTARPLPDVCFRLVDPSGGERIVTLAGATTSDPVAALTAAIVPSHLRTAPEGAGLPGEPPAWDVRIDGRKVETSTPLVASGLRRGSVVRVDALPAACGPHEPRRPSPLVDVVWTSGPDAARTVTLPAGRWIVGRAPGADVRADDPQLATHQGILTIDYDSRVTYCDLGVGRPGRLNGEPVTDVVVVSPGDVLALGAGALTVADDSQKGAPSSGGESSPARCVAGVRPQSPAHTWSDVLHRPPRRPLPSAPSPLAVPDLGSAHRTFGSGVGIISAITTLGGGIVMAVVLHQIVLMVMVGVGAAAALVTAAVQALRRRRGDGRTRRRTAAELRRFAVALEARRLATEAAERASGMSLSVAAVRAGSGPRPGSDLGSRCGTWEIRPDDAGFFTVELGRGDRRCIPPVDTEPERLPLVLADLLAAHSALHDVPIRVTIGAGDVVGVCGDGHAARAIVRSMVCQLASASGPADFLLAVLTSPRRATAGERHEPWGWTKWLPQSCEELIDDDDLLAVCESAAAAGRRVLVVTDRPAALSTRTTALRRAMHGTATNVSVVVIADDVSTLPSLCTGIVQANVDGSAVWQPVDGGDGVVQRFQLVGASEATAADIASLLGRYADPELHTAGGANLGDVELLELLGGRVATAAAIAEQWARCGHDGAPSALIGQSPSGAIEIDLHRDGPHGLIAGTTGAGKSELLRTIVVALSAASPPEQLSFVLIDYKGGAAFDRCAALPHVVGIVTDLDEHLAGRVLRSLDAEIRRREQALRELRVADLGDYRAAVARSGDRSPRQLSRLVIVVDEFAAMAAELPGFLSSLVSVAQRGRSLGMHLLLATQRPAGVVNDEIRANTNMRIALRVQDASDSSDVLGDAVAASLPRRCPGRAVIRLGADELETFQAARCTGPAPTPDDGAFRLLCPDVATGADDAPQAGTPSGATSLDVVVARIREAAAGRDDPPPHRPWLDPLPELVPRSALGGEGVGMVDLPDDQRRAVLTWAPGDGHLVVAGALGSGATTALVTVALHAAEQSDPAALHLYVIDAAGSSALDPLGGLAHCAGVVRVAEQERRARLLARLRRLTVERAASGPAPGDARVLLLVDGLGGLRSQLLEASRPDELVDLERIIADGPSAGIAVAASVDGAGSIPQSLASRTAARWVLHLTDVGEATALGVPRERWPARMPPGRGVVVGSGLEFQLAVDAEPIGDVVATINAGAPRNGAPQPIEVLPATIDAGRLPPVGRRPGPGVYFDLGLRADDLSTATLCLFDGEHACVAGASRSGRTTALVTIAASWRRQHPDGELSIVAPRSAHAFADAGLLARDTAAFDPCAVVGALHASWADRRAGADGPSLLIVDDAELVEDVGGHLQECVAAQRPGFHVVVGARVETLRSYGHWCSGVRRSRKGLLLGPVSDVDGDVLGVFLPRHRAAPPAGRGFLVADGSADLVHVAGTPATDPPLIASDHTMVGR